MLHVSEFLEVVLAFDKTYSDKFRCNFLGQYQLNCFFHGLSVSRERDPANKFEFCLDFSVEDDDIAKDGFILVLVIR